MAAVALYNPDNIRDVAESVGISNLSKELVELLCRDVDYRIAQVIELAIKFMRHGKRTCLHTDDITQALKVLDIEPLFGYDSTRPMRFGEAPLGPGQSLFYLEDDEVDFEKLINAPLPKVPREISFTAHWLAIEGVQPSIPQNPTSTDSTRHQELLPKGPNANPNLAALGGYDTTVKPLVKHILSAEIQLYFERITTAILDENNEEYRHAAFNSVRTDPGLHQLIPYFNNFVAEKVTHSLKDIFVLTQMLHLTNALLQNNAIFIDPYITGFVPPVLTCLIGKSLGSLSDSVAASTELRDLAASLVMALARKHGKSITTLKPRLARTLLKAFLDPNKSFGAHYGAIMGLLGLVGSEGVRVLILPNLKLYNNLLVEGLADESRKEEAQMVVMALLKAIDLLSRDAIPMMNGIVPEENMREMLTEKIGDVLASRIANQPKFAKAVLEAQIPLG